MTCREWRNREPEEANRYSRAYDVVAKFPGVHLDTALSLVATGQDPAEYLARKSKPSPKASVLASRRAVSNAEVAAFLQRLVANRVQVSVTLASSTFTDVLIEDLPTEFRFERSGPTEKLQIVTMTESSVASQYSPTKIDPQLAAQPAPISPAPTSRPVNDPRLFQPHIDETIGVILRNGATYQLRLVAVGPYDLLLGKAGQELFVPLHALMSWEALAPKP
jgi:hypothetical protein